MITSLDIAAVVGWLAGTIAIFIIVDGAFYFMRIKKTTGRLIGTYFVLAAIGLTLYGLGHGGRHDFWGAARNILSLVIAFGLSYFRMRGQRSAGSEG